MGELIEALRREREGWGAESALASDGLPLPARIASLSLLPVIGLLAASLFGVWLSVRTGDETARFAGIEVPVLRVVLLAAVGIVLLGVVIEGVLLRRWPLSVSAVGGAFVLVVAVVMLLLEEIAASLIPTSFLPTSVRRLTVDVYGGPGIWLGALAAVVLVIGSRVDGGGVGLARTFSGMVALLPGKLLAMLGAAGAAVGVAAWSRYQPWASGSVATQHVEVPGWSLPFIGPSSLVAILVLGGAALMLVVRRNLPAALALAVTGWACSFLAAVTLVTASTLARVEVDRFLPEAVADQGPSVGPQWGAWVMFAMGCAVAACGVGIVAWLEREAS